MIQDDFFAGTDNHFDVGGIVTVDNVFSGQQMGGRDSHSSNLVQGDDGEPKFIPAFQYKHDHVSVSDA